MRARHEEDNIIIFIYSFNSILRPKRKILLNTPYPCVLLRLFKTLKQYCENETDKEKRKYPEIGKRTMKCKENIHNHIILITFQNMKTKTGNVWRKKGI